MSNLDPIIKRLSDAGIRQVAVIDDVFDGPKEIDVLGELAGFFPAVERADDEEALCILRERFKVEAASDVTVATAQSLWEDFANLHPILKDNAERLLGEFLRRKRDLDLVCTHLKTLGLEVFPFGDPQGDPMRLPPDSVPLVFLDYSLTPGEGKISDASEWCARQLCERGEKRPFLVLISDHPDAPSQECKFREDTQRLSGTFAFVAKDVAKNEGAFCLHLATWGVGHPARRRIQEFVDSVTLSMDETIGAFTDALRDLTVQDYSVIQRICLEEDGQPLGEYMLGLFTGLLSHEFQKNSQIQDSRKALDQLVFETVLVSSTAPRPQLARMYRMALTEPVVGDVGPHPHEKPVSEILYSSAENAVDVVADKTDSQTLPPLLSLGDMFIKSADDPLLMVINAACDLSFSPTSKGRKADLEQPIFLIPGEMAPLRNAHSIAGREVTELFEHEEAAYRILWDYRHVRAIPLRDFGKDIIDQDYHRVARLALPYALKIQRRWTSHLDRVGLPAPPPMFEEADVHVWTRNVKDSWQNIRTVNRGALLFRRRTSDGYEDLALLTLNGEADVHGAFIEASEIAEQRVKQWGEELEKAPPDQQDGRRKRIKGFQTACDQFRDFSEDTSLRLRLMESPIRLDTHDHVWIESNFFAAYFSAGAKPSFIRDAQFVIDISPRAQQSRQSQEEASAAISDQSI